MNTQDPRLTTQRVRGQIYKIGKQTNSICIIPDASSSNQSITEQELWVTFGPYGPVFDLNQLTAGSTVEVEYEEIKNKKFVKRISIITQDGAHIQLSPLSPKQYEGQIDEAKKQDNLVEETRLQNVKSNKLIVDIPDGVSLDGELGLSVEMNQPVMLEMERIEELFNKFLEIYTISQAIKAAVEFHRYSLENTTEEKVRSFAKSLIRMIKAELENEGID